MTCRCRRRRPNSSPPPALEDDDLLAEILLRLPPQPSSLPRASLTCKRWRRLIRDPGFLRRFRAHHRSRGTAPVLGFFTKEDSGISFHPTLDPPNRVPPERFRLHITGSPFNCRIVCCRDGLVLLVNVHPGQVLVWDPVTGDQRRLLLPLVFRNYDKFYSGMVLRCPAAIGDGDHFRFQVVLVRCIKGRHARAVACVYSSDTRAWGDLIQISTPLLRALYVERPKSGALVGRSLCWLLCGKSTAILEFDLDRQNLAVIPSDLKGWIMSSEGGGLASVSLCAHTAQIWKREIGSNGVAKWMLTKTIHLDKLLPLSPGDRFFAHFAEENSMLVLGFSEGIFTVQTESMQIKKLPVNIKELPYVFIPFSSVYTAEMGVGAEHAGALAQ
ncbi:putative F-box protein At3g16210 [Lolium perenne]